jgi:hypothetical protein
LEFSWGVVELWEVVSELETGAVAAVPFGVVEETGVEFCACTEARSRRAKVATTANLVSFFIRPLLTVDLRITRGLSQAIRDGRLV